MTELQGLCIDWLPPSLLVTLYDHGLEQTAIDLAAGLLSQEQGIARAWLQRRASRRPDYQLLHGDAVDSHWVTEAGLKYQVSFNRGLHTGFFLDMANARAWVRQRAKGRKVLNLFAHTCAFSVAALAGGADEVINLDMNAKAMQQGRQNHRINNLDQSRVRFLGHDLFKSFGKLRRHGPYNLIIVDPPSYQPGSFVAEKDYLRVVRRLPELAAAGCELLLCLNSPHLDSAFLKDAVKSNAPDFVFQHRLENPIGFVDVEPEKALKVLFFKGGELTTMS